MITKVLFLIITVQLMVSSSYVLDYLSKETSLTHFLPTDPLLALKIGNTVPFMFTKMNKIAKMKNRNHLTSLWEEAVHLLYSKFFKVEIKESDVVFYLYDAQHKNNTPESLENISKRNGKIFFIIHGFGEDITDAKWYEGLSENLLKVYNDSHVIQVDWGALSNVFIYPLAALRTNAVGDFMAETFSKMVFEYGVPLENIIPIGFSLGGQILGQAGEKFYKKNKVKLSKIIALDPAGPLFEGLPIDERLDASDAETVIVLHTNGLFCGYDSACGTIDFFANDGRKQPECTKSTIFCSHERSGPLLSSALIAREKFRAKRCKSYQDFKNNRCDDAAEFLGNIDTKENGTFYFSTSDSPSFFKNRKLTFSTG